MVILQFLPSSPFLLQPYYHTAFLSTSTVFRSTSAPSRFRFCSLAILFVVVANKHFAVFPLKPHFRPLPGSKAAFPLFWLIFWRFQRIFSWIRGIGLRGLKSGLARGGAWTWRTGAAARLRWFAGWARWSAGGRLWNGGSRGLGFRRWISRFGGLCGAGSALEGCEKWWCLLIGRLCGDGLFGLFEGGLKGTLLLFFLLILEEKCYSKSFKPRFA